MTSRASIAAMLLVSYIAPGRAETIESLSQVSGLTLFMSAEEQQALDKDQSAVPLVDLESSSDDSPVLKPDDIAEVINHAVSSIRYDGIVMRGDQILGVWFDGIRVPDIEKYKGTDISVINSGGQLQLVNGKHSVKLFPGEYYSPQSGEIVRSVMLVPENTTEPIVDASGRKIDIGEPNISDLGMDESDLSDLDLDKLDPIKLDPVKLDLEK